jgi:PAS domain-containing protein/anti-sigma regulatory factor (Ser/Thr protein kinase)
MFVLQVSIVLLLTAAAVVVLVLDTQRDSLREATNRSLAVAESFAQSPGIVEALGSPDPTAVLQPRAEAARERTGVDFVVVMTRDGIRYTHPVPDRIGGRFVGTIAPAQAGGIVTETYEGALGPSVRAVVPVRGPGDSVVGLVSAGVTLENVSAMIREQLPVVLGAAAAAVALTTGGAALLSRRLLRQTHGLGPTEITRMYEHHDAVLHSVKEGVLIVDDNGRLLLANDEAQRLLDLTPEARGRYVRELGLAPATAALLASGREATDEVHLAGDRLLAVNQRSTDQYGPAGSVATFRDSTELQSLSSKEETARNRLKVLYDAGVSIGTTLDVTRTAEELAEASVPRFADFVTVDLAEAVLRGNEPESMEKELRRTASAGIRDDHPLYPTGELIRFVSSTPQVRSLTTGLAVIEPDLQNGSGWQVQDLERGKQIIDYGIHSLITAPLAARGIILGVANFWRSEKPEPFEGDDLSLAEELVARAAVCIDNARRYTREHSVAVALQRSLLPRGLPEQNALEVAYRYLPAQPGVGGDWFDVIPLTGARVALVVGDVVGQGLHAAATMGLLRTAVLNLSSLDLPPDELLARLDELADRIHRGGDPAEDADTIVGATCLYAIYDPVERRCTMARAGHLPPAIVRADGDVEFPELPAGPPLGLGGLPFRATELELPEGSELVLYTNGLVYNRERDLGSSLDVLRSTLSRVKGGPERICAAALNALPSPRPSDDIALLVARTRVLPADRVARWDVPPDPAAVGHVRGVVSRQLAEWDLEETSFITELILSELVTNAIRYATGPIGVRLLLDRCLICEVSDGSSTSPHLRYAATTDEGGRGLFLVAQFADRWGTRYMPEGKVIWAEQSLPDESGAPPTLPRSG